ncbi:hypothetical protein [Nocardioides sp.]|uniref:hypothetical protein n=1 Tax=Nocardioides sp. TaxID=35761 RepID=UPI001A319758|nr:hypothetical protein [Nocardioides sp.]MBJ7358651.1 hypothetical protein [Nocardioides sp.]
MLILGMIVLALLATAGLTLIKASRDLDAADDSDLGPVAGFVDERLQRTRSAVDTLIQPDVSAAELRPSRHALAERATTYGVFGLGLVGIAAFVAIGYVLLGG